MHLYAWNTILEHKNSDQQTILQVRKCNLSGKRRVVDGKHLMMGAKLIRVRKAEESTKQCKAPKKDIVKRKGWSKVKERYNNEFEAYVTIINDEEVEILDCIEVET